MHLFSVYNFILRKPALQEHHFLMQIVPEGLAKKRIWCKKYPIAVTFATAEKFCGELLNDGIDPSSGGGVDKEVNSGKAKQEKREGNKKDGGEKEGGKVTFSKDEKGNEKVRVSSGGKESANKPKGEVYRDGVSCAGKTIYLFARCDREKDDW